MPIPSLTYINLQASKPRQQHLMCMPQSNSCDLGQHSHATAHWDGTYTVLYTYTHQDILSYGHNEAAVTCLPSLLSPAAGLFAIPSSFCSQPPSSSPTGPCHPSMLPLTSPMSYPETSSSCPQGPSRASKQARLMICWQHSTSQPLRTWAAGSTTPQPVPLQC